MFTRKPSLTRPVAVIGHRGARGLFPENTIEGFRAAHTLGVRWFELDVGMTADGVVVVSHDLALNPAITRDAAGRWIDAPGPPIHGLTLAALRTYDVGRIRPMTPYRMLFRAQKGMDGARIPTLEDVLRLSPEARFLIELKTDPRYPDRTVSPARLAEAVLAVVDATGTADRVMLESFDWRGPRHALRLRPGIRTAWLTSADTTREAALWWGGIPPSPSIPQAVAAAGLPHESVPFAPKGALPRELATELPRELPRVLSRELPRELADAPVADAPVWAPAWETLTRAAVAEAHALGLRVMPWTVNRRAAMRLLTGWGVDGLITDRPDVAWDVVGPETGVPHSVML